MTDPSAYTCAHCGKTHYSMGEGIACYNRKSQMSNNLEERVKSLEDEVKHLVNIEGTDFNLIADLSKRVKSLDTQVGKMIEAGKLQSELNKINSDIIAVQKSQIEALETSNAHLIHVGNSMLKRVKSLEDKPDRYIPPPRY